MAECWTLTRAGAGADCDPSVPLVLRRSGCLGNASAFQPPHRPSFALGLRRSPLRLPGPLGQQGARGARGRAGIRRSPRRGCSAASGRSSGHGVTPGRVNLRRVQKVQPSAGSLLSIPVLLELRVTLCVGGQRGSAAVSPLEPLPKARVSSAVVSSKRAGQVRCSRCRYTSTGRGKPQCGRSHPTLRGPFPAPQKSAERCWREQEPGWVSPRDGLMGWGCFCCCATAFLPILG